MRVGHTYTRHFDLETRQHELLGLDLGEGLPRRALILTLALYTLWTGTLLLVFGLPSRYTFTAYFLPPLLTGLYGAQRSRKNDRRWNLTYWAVAIRYQVLGHRPIICGGRRAATRSEWISRRARVGRKADLLLEAPGLAAPVARWLGPDQHHAPTGAGTSLHLDARPRLYGPDAVAKAYGRKAMKGARA